MNEVAEYRPSRDAFRELLGWMEGMSGWRASEGWSADFPLTDEELTFVCVAAELGSALPDDTDHDLVMSLVVEYGRALRGAGDVVGEKALLQTKREVRTIMDARFGIEGGESAYDTLRAYAETRITVEAAAGPHSIQELTAMADRLVAALPEVYERIRLALVPAHRPAVETLSSRS